MQVGELQVEVARSGAVECASARRVARSAYESFLRRPENGSHGIIEGFKCWFDSAFTEDFTLPDGPILFCRSWNRFVVGSAEPDDPVSKWSFSPPFLGAIGAMRAAIDRVTSGGGVPWVERKDRSADCSRALSRLERRCVLRWRSGADYRRVTLQVRLVPRRWDDPAIQVLRLSPGR
jgi:hypothetical protein